MLTRRSLLGGILAAASGPLILRSGVARGIIMPVRWIAIPDLVACTYPWELTRAQMDEIASGKRAFVWEQDNPRFGNLYMPGRPALRGYGDPLSLVP